MGPRSRKTIKTGVSFPSELLESFDRVLREMGISSRSQGLLQILGSLVVKKMWRGSYWFIILTTSRVSKKN
jgi:metal-responsive CopG/Arc/MetJ family transcriptional regulator